MKNITFLDSIKCAVKGMKYAFKTEKNFKYYFFIALFFLVAPHAKRNCPARKT